MRKKPLNPNCMAVIMENFKHYVNENANEEDTERIYLLQEGKVSEETTLSVLMEKRDRGEIDIVELVDLMNESTQHEFNQLFLLMEEETNEGLLDFFKRKSKAPADEPGKQKSKAPADEPGKQKKGLKYKLREKGLTFLYSKVAAYIKATFGQDKEALGPMVSNLQKGQAALKAGNAKEGLKLLGAAGFNTALKGVKLLFRAMLKIVKGIAFLVRNLAKVFGSFFKNPVIRVAILAGLIMMMFQVVTVSGALYAGWRVANQATAVVTGKSAAGHALGAAAKGVGTAAKKAVGLAEENITEFLDTGIQDMSGAASEGAIMTFAEALGSVDANTLGAAILQLAKQLEGLEVQTYSSSVATQYVDSNGTEVVYQEVVFEASDVALKREMEAIGLMKDALRQIAAGADVDTQGHVFKETGEAMKGAIEAAKAACQSDPAHCAGADKLASTVREVWSGDVSGGITDIAQQTSDGAMRVIKDATTQYGTASVKISK